MPQVGQELTNFLDHLVTNAPTTNVMSEYMTYFGLIPLPLSHFSITNCIHCLAKLTRRVPSFCRGSPVTNLVTSFRYCNTETLEKSIN